MSVGCEKWYGGSGMIIIDILIYSLEDETVPQRQPRESTEMCEIAPKAPRLPS